MVSHNRTIIEGFVRRTKNFWQDAICVFALTFCLTGTSFAQSVQSNQGFPAETLQSLDLEQFPTEMFDLSNGDQSLKLMEDVDYSKVLYDSLFTQQPELTYPALEPIIFPVETRQSFGAVPFQVVPGQEVKEEALKLPMSPERERILQAVNETGAKTCSVAATDWKIILDAFGGFDPNVSFSDIIGDAISNDLGVFSMSANTYQQTCMAEPSSLSQDLLNAGIASYTAVLTESDSPICGALRIDSKKYLTARHCFFNKDDGKIHRKASDVKVSLLADGFITSATGTGLAIQGNSVSGNVSAFTIPEDYVVLSVDTELGTFKPFKTDYSAVDGELVVLGYFRFHDVNALETDFLGNVSDPVWKNGLRWTDSKLCTFADLNDPCKAHFCQTDARFSGAPIFSKSTDNGQIVVRGMHIAAMGETQGCNFKWVKNAGNIAINTP